jgi:hypothetical protein
VHNIHEIDMNTAETSALSRRVTEVVIAKLEKYKSASNDHISVDLTQTGSQILLSENCRLNISVLN